MKKEQDKEKPSPRDATNAEADTDTPAAPPAFKGRKKKKKPTWKTIDVKPVGNTRLRRISGRR